MLVSGRARWFSDGGVNRLEKPPANGPRPISGGGGTRRKSPEITSTAKLKAAIRWPPAFWNDLGSPKKCRQRSRQDWRGKRPAIVPIGIRFGLGEKFLGRRRLGPRTPGGDWRPKLQELLTEGQGGILIDDTSRFQGRPGPGSLGDIEYRVLAGANNLRQEGRQGLISRGLKALGGGGRRGEGHKRNVGRHPLPGARARPRSH